MRRTELEENRIQLTPVMTEFDVTALKQLAHGECLRAIGVQAGDYEPHERPAIMGSLKRI